MVWLLIIPVLPYFLLLIYIYSGLFWKNTGKPDNSDDIKVSVIIACRDEEKNLSKLLNDLVSQDYSSEMYEVIVVDDHSIDNTGIIATSFYYNGTFRSIRNNGIGKKSALRTGIMDAKGDLILTTDADCKLSKGWIRSMVSFWKEENPDIIIGPVRLLDGSQFVPWFQELEFLSLQGVTAGTAGIGHPVMCNGANLAFTAETYKKYSGDLHLEIASGDDVFLLHRIKADKGRILCNDDKDSIVETKGAGSFISFLRQRARWVYKSGAYDDLFTKVLALITLTMNIGIVLLIGGAIYNPVFFPVLLAAIILKSIPDILILSRVTARYKKTNLLWWFIPSQVIYPFYVITVSVYSLFRRNKW